MPIKIPSSGGGGWLPTLKFNAVSGEWQLKNAVNEWEKQDVTKIKGLLVCPLSLTGYFNFNSNPPFKMYGQHMEDELVDPKNGANFGVATVFYSPNSLGNIFEFTSTSWNVCEILGDLISKWENDPEGKSKNQIPAVQCNGIKKKEGSKTIYLPEFEILKYLPIPDDCNIEFNRQLNQYMRIDATNTVAPSSGVNGSIQPTAEQNEPSQVPVPPATPQQGNDYF